MKAARYNIEPESLISNHFPLDEVNKSFVDMQEEKSII